MIIMQHHQSKISMDGYIQVNSVKKLKKEDDMEVFLV